MLSLTKLFILSLLGNLSHQTPFCDQINPTMSPNDPSFPVAFDQYQTDVEVTMSEISHTVTVRQYVDRPGNRTALYIYENGQQQIIIVDFPSKQLFNINDGVCNVNGISASNYTVGLADYILEGIMFDPVQPDDRQNKIYLGPTKVRGISVNHWKSCPFTNKLRANYTVDHYFSDWDGPEVPETLVQKIADGDRTLANGTMIHFRHVFDIVDFKPNIDDNTVFMTPLDVVCVGRQKTRPVPTLSNHVHFVREQRIDRSGPISYAEVWYDYEQKLARYDIRSTAAMSFIPAQTPTAEVHDFNYGVRYTRDRISGRCVANPLNVSIDDTFHPVSINRSQPLQMDTTQVLLRVSSDLAFTGQRYIRGLLCDEYESQQMINGTKSVVKHYFLEQGMQMLPDDSGGVPRTVLVRITFYVPTTGFYYRVDLLRYDEDIPDISVFDVTSCYSKAAQVQLSVTFQGYYQFGLRDQLKTGGRKQLQLALGVSPMRLPTVNIDYDRSFVYMKAWLLEKTLDIGTINGPSEVNATQAYDNLVNAVNNGIVQVRAYLPYVKDAMVYTAVDVNVIFGFLRSPQFPNIQAQFSYHLENTVPKLKSTFNSHIWYDYQYKLVRYDITQNGGDPMENIHDYNTGLAYEINRASGECFVGPIGPKSFDVASPSQSGGYVLKMRNPIQFLDLSQNYVYTGQKTVRERLCNVYENVANFSFGGTNKLAVYQFYSSTSAWHQLSEGSSQAVVGQPMRMIVTAADAKETEIFDFMDFNQEDPDLSNFNIQPCYRKSNQQAHFSIIFHNSARNKTDMEDFRKMAQLMLAEVAGISPLRLQNPQLTVFRTVIGYIATLVQQAPAILDFTKTTNKQSMYSSDATYPGVVSEDECAGICRNMTSFPCESFDYCPTSGLCQLSKSHASDGNKLHNSAQCHHYSRTVNGEVHIEPTNGQALTMWQDRIDRGTLQLKLTSNKKLTYAIYPATRLMRDVLRFDEMTAINANLAHFTRQYALEPPKYSNAAGSVVSIDACAQSCLAEVTFECQSFLYCPIYGYCRPVPDYLVKNSTNSGDDIMQCYAFSRKYTDSYVSYPGYHVTRASGHVILGNVQDEEMCAKKCSKYSPFPCKSFEYCATSKDCFLSKDHGIISPTAVSSTTTATSAGSCSHFSKKYLYDFQKTPKKSLLTSQVLTFYNETIENCARLCVENSGYSCESFTYCANITTCSVTSAITSSSRAHVTASESCDLYTRVYKTGSPPAPQTQPKPQAAVSGFGSGVMAAVAIAMLLVGMVVGAGFLYFCRTKAIVERLQTLEMRAVNPRKNVDDQS